MNGTLEIKQRTLGAEHPFTLNTRHNLANILLRLGKAREAEAINRDVLTIRRRVIGAHHPSTLKTQANLGRTLIRQRRLDEAETELRAAWTAQVTHRGESHSDTLATKRTLDHCQALSARQSRTSFVGIRKTSMPNPKNTEKQNTDQKTASHP